MTEQTKEIDGVPYRKYSDEKFWKPNTEYRPTDEVSEPIICDCGGKLFKIRYGNYSVDATCGKCWHNEEVYTG